MNPAVSSTLATLRSEAAAVGKSVEQHAAEKLHATYAISGYALVAVLAVGLILGAVLGVKVL